MKLSAQEKLRLIEAAQKGEKITDLCRKAHISRFTFYKWYQRWQKAKKDPHVLENNYLKGNKHWKRLSSTKEKAVLEVIAGHPKWSSHRIANFLKHSGLKISNHGVQRILERKTLNKQSLRFDFQSTKNFKTPDIAAYSFKPIDKLHAVLLYLDQKKSVSSVCRQYGLSRDTFYRWLKRYQESPENWLLSLSPRYAKEDHHYKYIPKSSQEEVLKLVSANPEYSAHKIHQILKTAVGHHGIQNILKRNNLNTYSLRVAFART